MLVPVQYLILTFFSLKEPCCRSQLQHFFSHYEVKRRKWLSDKGDHVDILTAVQQLWLFLSCSQVQETVYSHYHVVRANLFFYQSLFLYSLYNRGVFVYGWCVWFFFYFYFWRMRGSAAVHTLRCRIVLCFNECMRNIRTVSKGFLLLLWDCVSLFKVSCLGLKMIIWLLYCNLFWLDK